MEVQHGAFVVVVEGFHSLASHPAAAHAHALQEGREVESLPLQVVGKAEGVAREVVAHHEAVVVIDDFVAVLVHVADITGAGHDALEVRAGGSLLVALEKTVASECIVGIERIAFLNHGNDVVAVVEGLALGVHHLVPAVGDVAGDVVVHGAGAEVVVHGEFPALAGHRGGVGGGSTVAEQAGNRQAHQNVAGAVVKVVEGDIEVVLQECHIQADVRHAGGLPLDGRIHGGEVGRRNQFSAEVVALGHGNGLHVAVGANAVVTHKTPASAQLQGRNHRADVLPPGFLGNAPAKGQGREQARAVAFGKVGGVVVTDVELGQVLLIIIIGEAAEGRVQGPVGGAAAVGHFITGQAAHEDIVLGVVGQALCVVVLSRFSLVGVTHQGGEVVLLTKGLLIVERNGSGELGGTVGRLGDVVFLVAGSCGSRCHAVLVRTVIEGTSADGGVQVQPVNDAEIGIDGAADVLVAALAVSAGFQALQGVGVGAGRIVVGTVGILDFVDGGHAVALLDDPLRPVGVVLGDVAGILGRSAHREAVAHLVGQVDTSVITVVTVAGALEQAVLVYITEGGHVGEVLGAAGDGEVVVVLHGGVLVQLVDPLDVGAAVAERCNLLGAEFDAAAGVHGGLVVELGIDPGIYHGGKGGGLLPAHAHVVVHVHFAFAALLGGDQDDAVGGA